MPNDAAAMLDGNRIASLAFARQRAGDTDGFFQAVHFGEAVFARFTNDPVGIRVHSASSRTVMYNHNG